MKSGKSLTEYNRKNIRNILWI